LKTFMRTWIYRDDLVFWRHIHWLWWTIGITIALLTCTRPTDW
jgi:hypothetical protein